MIIERSLPSAEGPNRRCCRRSRINRRATSVIYDAFFDQRMAKISTGPILRHLYVRSD